MNNTLSVIIPSYNEAAMIDKTASTIEAVLSSHRISHELIFIDDGSKDETWNQIQIAASKNKSLRGLRFSRNFGKESAIMAGLALATGDCCCIIDCDLQHPPQKIVDMYALWQNGYEVIEGQKSSRGNESRFHSWAARSFYALISKATGIDMSRSSDFKLLDRKAVNALLSIREQFSFFRALSGWIGFRTAIVEYDVQDRSEGTSKWNTISLIRYAIRNITSFSSAPMQLVTIMGVMMLAIALVFSAIAIAQKIAGVALGGFTTVILLLLFSASMIMISLGIIGYYLSKIYDEIKDRPRYIISDTCN